MNALSPIVLPLADALHCIAAEDVVAEHPVPRFDTCTIDGFAVRSSDRGELRIIDEVPAGFVTVDAVVEGTAMRVAAGTMLPEGADAVVPWVPVTEAIDVPVSAPGSNVLRAGARYPAGASVCAAGTLIDAQVISVLAATGHRTVLVHPRPRVVIVPIGAELARGGEPLRPGLIEDVTGVTLLAEAKLNQADAYLAEPVRDDPDSVAGALEEARVRADLIVTTGGLGVLEGGELARTLGTSGGRTELDGLLVIALPGEPQASLDAFRAQVSPLIQRLRGI